MKKIVIPKTLKIGGHVYEVVFPYKFKEIGQLVGMHDTLRRRILISPVDLSGLKRPFSDVLRTWFHEMLHGINKVYCGMGVGTEDEEERIIESLAEGLTQVFLDNEMPYEE